LCQAYPFNKEQRLGVVKSFACNLATATSPRFPTNVIDTTLMDGCKCKSVPKFHPLASEEITAIALGSFVGLVMFLTGISWSVRRRNRLRSQSYQQVAATE
jgi:hypothetical protein